jgi:hypothetical protein
MKSFLISITLLSSLAFAETATINIEGMHCSGCKAMIEDKVCKDTTTNKDFSSCSVKLVDEDKQTGQVTIVTKEGMKVNIDAVKAGIKAAGDDYKVASVDVKETQTSETAVKQKVRTKKIAKKVAPTKKENK